VRVRDGSSRMLYTCDGSCRTSVFNSMEARKRAREEDEPGHGLCLVHGHNCQQAGVQGAVRGLGCSGKLFAGRLTDLQGRLRALPGGSSTAEALSVAHAACCSGRLSDVDEATAAVLDAGWTALHSGHWSQVDGAWRSAYMAAAFLSAASETSGATALRTIDLGLMVGDTSFRSELLRAADHLESAAPQAAIERGSCGDFRRLEPHAVEEPRPLSGTLPSLPRLRLPSLAFFYNQHMVPATPCVLTEVLDGWPARTTRPWSDSHYLKALLAERTVPVEVGSHYLDDGFEERLVTFAQFFESHIEPPPPPPGASRAYLAQHQLFEQCPALRRDLVTPDYCLLSLDDDSQEGEGEGEGRSDDDVRVNAWFGPAATLSPLHYDRSHNLLCQVVGSKYVRLYAPEHSERLYAHTSGPHQVSSRIVDPDRVDASAFPRFAEAPYVDVVLGEGEVLYIPPRWWHFIESRETSFSVSFWW